MTMIMSCHFITFSELLPRHVRHRLEPFKSATLHHQNRSQHASDIYLPSHTASFSATTASSCSACGAAGHFNTGPVVLLALDARGPCIWRHYVLLQLLHDLQHGFLEHVRHVDILLGRGFEELHVIPPRKILSSLFQYFSRCGIRVRQVHFVAAECQCDVWVVGILAHSSQP